MDELRQSAVPAEEVAAVPAEEVAAVPAEEVAAVPAQAFERHRRLRLYRTAALRSSRIW